MGTRGRVPLPRGLVDFHVAVACLPAPDSVVLIMDAVREACDAEMTPRQKPLVVLNRSFGQLRRQHPTIFSDLATWLACPATKQAASEVGAYWAWAKWCQAADKLMEDGVLASAAFGADQPGRPKSRQFSAHEDAALLAEYLAPRLGSSGAEEEARAIRNSPPDLLDSRTLQRARVMVRACRPSNAELEVQAGLVKHKYYGRQNGGFPPVTALDQQGIIQPYRINGAQVGENDAK
jgi:hypothetical protein